VARGDGVKGAIRVSEAEARDEPGICGDNAATRRGEVRVCDICAAGSSEWGI